jgi:DNA repair exonuclease SbcCD ATPase subunit
MSGFAPRRDKMSQSNYAEDQRKAHEGEERKHDNYAVGYKADVGSYHVRYGGVGTLPEDDNEETVDDGLVVVDHGIVGGKEVMRWSDYMANRGKVKERKEKYDWPKKEALSDAIVGDGVVLDRCPGCGAIKLAQDALCSACFVAEYKECAKESYDINEQKLALEQELDRVKAELKESYAELDKANSELKELHVEIKYWQKSNTSLKKQLEESYAENDELKKKFHLGQVPDVEMLKESNLQLGREVETLQKQLDEVNADWDEDVKTMELLAADNVSLSDTNDLLITRIRRMERVIAIAAMALEKE